jgi:uncharacterized protein (TIGR02646 family)
MRYFQRQALDVTIQSQLSSKTSTNFGSLTSAQRNEILAKLLASQKSLCGYCECPISYAHYHFEHFEEQHDAPTRIFDYSNLLLSCEGERNPVTKPEPTMDKIYRKDNISCGHRKTKGQHGEIEIDYALLLNPSNNVSALFSYFDGVVEPSKTCNLTEIEQVKYTIKRLNMDASRLENARISQIDEVQKLLEDLTEAQQKTYISSLLDETQNTLNPYFSTIKDNFDFILRT